MSSFISKKTYVCYLCGNVRKGNLDTRNDPVCYKCVLYLLGVSQASKKKLYQSFINKNEYKKARYVGNFITEEGQNEEQREIRRSLARKRPHSPFKLKVQEQR